MKYYLEAQGCKVLASEFNDFQKPLEKHSYEACLSAIEGADYFILLVGARVGGWYDKPNQVSITQSEYRYAYKLQKSGRLKVINFVRASIWQVREDRQELARHLKDLAINDAEKEEITNFPSKFANDAKFLSKFITEIGRNEETRMAVQGEANAPTGNWIHTFNGFSDIVNVLQGQLFTSTPIEDLTLSRLLRRELRQIVGQCLVKFKAGAVYAPRLTIENFHKEHRITVDTKDNEHTTIQAKSWGKLSSLSVHLLSQTLHPTILPQAISSATYLKFDIESDSYVETEVYEALMLLQKEIRTFNKCNNNDTIKVIIKYAPKNRQSSGETFQMETIELCGLLHLVDRWSNILDLSKSLLLFLDGGEFLMPSLRLDSPVEGMQAQIDAERATEDDIDNYLRN